MLYSEILRLLYNKVTKILYYAQWGIRRSVERMVRNRV
jgi:hypothetical protein